VLSDPLRDGERPRGLLASLRSFVAGALASDPTPPPAWSPPRGLGRLNALLADVRSSPSGPVLPPIDRDAAGYSVISAREWCARAGLEPAVGVLAVLLASEASPRHPWQYAWAIGEACLNAAYAQPPPLSTLQDAIVRRCVGDSRPALTGRFGSQGGRWASTRQQPSRRHVRCAELLLARAEAGEPPILAGQASQWTDNDTQHLIHVAAVKKGDLKKAERNPPPEVVMARRYASGRRWVGPLVDALGEVVIDPWVLALIGPEGVSEAEAMAMLADGRKRWRRPA
jgi:hypothetical protein